MLINISAVSAFFFSGCFDFDLRLFDDRLLFGDLVDILIAFRQSPHNGRLLKSANRTQSFFQILLEIIISLLIDTKILAANIRSLRQMEVS